MSQAAVERCIGRLLTDEASRRRWRIAREATLTEILEGARLTATPAERAALLATSADAWDWLAETIDPRLQRLADEPSPAGRWRPGGPLVAALLSLMVTAGVAQAQPVASLTLDEARARVLARMPGILVERQDADIASAAADAAQAAWDPVVRIDSRVRSRTDPLNTLFSGAPDEALGPRTTGASTVATWSKLFASGAAITAQATASVDRTDSLLALLTPAYQGSVAVEVRQPLARGRRIDAPRQHLRVTQIDRSRTYLEVERAVIDAVAEVERAYWAWVSARQSVAVHQRSLGLAEAQRRDVEVRISAGTAAEADLATSDAAIAERRIAVIGAREQAEQAAIALRSLMAADADESAWSSPLEPAEGIPPAGSAPLAPADDLVQDALARRLEIRDLELLEQRAQLDEALAADRLRPQVDLVGGYAVRGLAGRQNPDARLPFTSVPIVVDEDLQGAWGQALQNAVGHRFADLSVGVQVTLPIGNRAALAERTITGLRSAQLETRRRATGVAIARDVWRAVTTLEAARARRTAATAAREAAARQLEAEQFRDEGGLSTDFLLLTRQSDLSRAELIEIGAAADEARAAADLDRATGHLLERRGIAWEMPR